MYTRRTFIRNMVIGTTALSFMPGTSFGKDAAMSRASADPVGLALIGKGKMGTSNLRSVLATKKAKLLAVCDVYDRRLQDAAKEHGDAILLTKDYMEILNNKDIEAVIVATPDHWHQQIAIDALKAGKHVYCEKPVIYDLQEGDALIKAQKESGMVFQTGSQGVSSWGNELARLIIDSGLIGPVNLIEGQFTVPPALMKTYVCPEGANEQTIGWNRFLGRAPQRPFEARRFFQWRNWKDYSTGLAGDLFVHVIASVQYIMQNPGPVKVYSTGGLNYYVDGSRDMPEVMMSFLDYPNISNKGAFTLALQANLVDGISKKWGSKDFMLTGARGSMRVEWDKVTLRMMERIPNELFKGLMSLGIEEPAKMPGHVYEFTAPKGGFSTHVSHHNNFLQAIRNEEQVKADILFGVNTASAALLCNQSYLRQEAISWNPQKI